MGLHLSSGSAGHESPFLLSPFTHLVTHFVGSALCTILTEAPHPLPPGPVLASVPLQPQWPFCCSHLTAFMNTDGPQPSPRPRTSPHSCLHSNVSSRWGLTRRPHLKLLLTFPRCHQSIIHRFISLWFSYCSWLPRKFSHLLLLCIVHFPFLPFPFLQTRYIFRERERHMSLLHWCVPNA